MDSPSTHCRPTLLEIAPTLGILSLVRMSKHTSKLFQIGGVTQTLKYKNEGNLHRQWGILQGIHVGYTLRLTMERSKMKMYYMSLGCHVQLIAPTTRPSRACASSISHAHDHHTPVDSHECECLHTHACSCYTLHTNVSMFIPCNRSEY